MQPQGQGQQQTAAARAAATAARERESMPVLPGLPRVANDADADANANGNGTGTGTETQQGAGDARSAGADSPEDFDRYRHWAISGSEDRTLRVWYLPVSREDQERKLLDCQKLLAEYESEALCETGRCSTLEL